MLGYQRSMEYMPPIPHILPIGLLYATYHLLRESGNSIELGPPKTNSSPLKIGHRKRKLVFQPFSGAMLFSGRVVQVVEDMYLFFEEDTFRYDG